MELGPTVVIESKGALTLRSNSVYYRRPTLVYHWHYNREAELKNYDIHEIPLGFKNLCCSTYWQLGTMDQKSYQDYSSQPYRIKEYKELEMHTSVLDKDNFELAVVDRETGLPETGVGAVLLRHSPDNFKMLVFAK
uniref:Cilia- and flagella-associated protein 95-like n=1 Tax=Pogona vitticeps TaxID=103695 RepID=A0ABM5FV68_9SAUR